ncbi:MAG TPA: M48 family metalloprotease, partial [Actinomycetota bacterium]|nr:M48 family metalloprotease [Actinomycetota bacterium]
MDDGLIGSRIRSVLLVALVFALAGGIGYGIGRLFGRTGLVGAAVALGIAAVTALWSYFFGDRLVLRASRAVPAHPREYAVLHNVVEGLCAQAGLPKPALYVIPEAAPNAFATGRDPAHAKIAVTAGLLESMNRVELEGVLAHELSHVAGRDVLLGTLVATLVGAIVLLFGWARNVLSWGAAQARAGRGIVSLLAWVVLSIGALLSFLAPLVAQILRLAI